MGDIKNPSFETEGAGQGEALHWTQSSALGAEDYAPFVNGDGDITSREGYDSGWDNDGSQNVFGVADLFLAMFEIGSHAYENYETSWGPPGAPSAPPTYNHQALNSFSLADLTFATFDNPVYGIEQFEDYEEDWSNNNAAQDVFAAPDLTYAAFDPLATENFEDYEEEWSNDTAQTVFAAPDLTYASFDVGVPEAVEDYEEEWTTLLT